MHTGSLVIAYSRKILIPWLPILIFGGDVGSCSFSRTSLEPYQQVLVSDRAFAKPGYDVTTPKVTIGRLGNQEACAAFTELSILTSLKKLGFYQ